MTDEQRFPLNWSDVKTWADRNPRTKPDPRRDGYYTACPVRTHRLKNQLISVWDGGDGHTHLHCWGGCTHQDVYEAIAEKIKPGAPPVTEPQSDQATPPQQVETPPAAGPLTVAAIESHWPAVIQLLRRGQTVHERNVAALLRDARVTGLLAWTTPAVRALLRDARGTAVQADEVTLEFEFPFHAEQVEKPENRLVTEKALQQVLGRPLRVRVVEQELKQAVTTAKTEHAQELEQAVATAKAGHAQELKQAMAAAQAERDQELEQAVAAAKAEHAQALEQAMAAAKAEHAQELEQAVAAAKAEHAQALEQAMAAARVEHAQELEQAVAAAKAGHAQELEQAVAAAKVEHAQELEQAMATAKAGHAQELEQAVAAAKTDLESRIEGIESKALTFDFIAAWGALENELEPLKKELIQDYRSQGQTYPIARERASINNQLDKARDKGYINKDECMDLQGMKKWRDDIAHRGHPLTLKLAHAYLEILLPVIDRLRPAKASSQDLVRLKAHYE